MRPSLRTALAGLVEHPDRPPLAWLTWRWYGVHEPDLAGLVEMFELLGLVTSGGVQPWAAAFVAGDGVAAEEAIEAALPAVQDDVVVQADGTAVVAGRPSTALRRLLDRIARPESERTWRISAECIRAAYDQGADAEELLSQLREHSRHAVPQVVERLVHDVAGRHGRIVVVPASTLLRVDDEPLAVTLLHDRKLAALGLRQVQPGVLSSTKKPAELLAALRAAGYAPAGPPEPARKRPTVKPVAMRMSTGPATDPADVARALRRSVGQEAQDEPLATVHQLRPAQDAAADRRFAHLLPEERVLMARALDTGLAVEIDYVDSGGRRTTRVVDEWQDLGGILEGWCHLRDDERNFSPEGIVGVRPV